MTFIDKLYRQVEDLRRFVERIRWQLVCAGTVAEVDAVTGFVVVEIDDVDDKKVKLLPTPWFQFGTEHRPPAVGDHALVIDTSLGHGGGVAICGFSSLARPPAGGGGDDHVIHKSRDDEAAIIDSPDVRLGESPTDFAALASRVLAELADIREKFDAHTHPVNGAVAAVPGTPALASTPTLPMGPPGSVAATQVRIK